MIYQNVLYHNVAELTANDDGSVSWLRVPFRVYDSLETEQGKRMAVNATGVELRFVLKGERAVIRMCKEEAEVTDGFFHIYRGGIQGTWEDHSVRKQVGTRPEDFEIRKTGAPDRLKAMAKECGDCWDSEVIRVIFDMGTFRIYDVAGEIQPPEAWQCPAKTLMCYGSSITHGSNSIDASHAWVSVLAHNLNMDARNLGMAGSCHMEPAMIDYIAEEGRAGRWDAALLELGINALPWEEEKIRNRVGNTIRKIAGDNPGKPVIVISPFYYCGEGLDGDRNGEKWRRLIRETVETFSYSNVTYFNGLEILDGMRYMAADEVHPNIYGVQRIADELTRRLGPLFREL